MCTLYKGVPYGLVRIQYKDPNSKWLSFEGIGIFTNGELHMGPFFCVDGLGYIWSFCHMMNGRPAENEYLTYFNAKRQNRYIHNLDKKTDAEGL